MTPDLTNLLRQGIQHHQAGHFSKARQLYQQALDAHPNNADALHLIGVLYQQTNQPQAAIEFLTRAVNLSPNTFEFVKDLAQALQARKQPIEAATSYRRALALRPNDIESLQRLAACLAMADRLNEAGEVYNHLLSMAPHNAAALSGLGAIQLRVGQIASAISNLASCIELNPADAMARENLGIALLFDKRFAACVEHFQQLIESGNAVVSTYHHLGTALLALGKPEEALAHLQKAVELDPKHVAAWETLGNCYRALKRNADAIAACRRGSAVSPSDVSLRCSLAIALFSDHQVDEGIEQCRIVIAQSPGYAFAHLALAGAFMAQGRQDESIEAARRAISLQPELGAVETKYLFSLHYSPTWTAEQVLAEISQWAARHAAPLYPVNPTFNNDRAFDRPIRIGFLSGEFRSHPVGRFLAHIFQQIDPAQVKIICFSDVAVPDELTARFRRIAREWHEIKELSDEEVARKIKAEQVDILVDLALFAWSRRLLVFARKPAPIQLTYLAYPGTSGLATMDYRISDPYIDPPGTENLYTERTLRIPSYWCYEATADVSEVSPPPLVSNGFVTFGCFNQFTKVTPAMLETWLKILAEVPNSRLLLVCDSNARFNQVQADFASRIDPGRIEQIRSVSTAEYFKLYHRIDITLDPHPFAGGTTSCDSLYMGVPIVTLAGRNGVSRGGVSILSQIGLTDLIAQSTDDYIRIATTLAADLPRLVSLRTTLRQRMQSSPLMDTAAFVANLQKTFRSIWIEWCRSGKNESSRNVDD